jgi:hypothetical protein
MILETGWLLGQLIPFGNFLLGVKAADKVS